MPVRQTQQVRCLFPDCPREKVSKGLCSSHYQQHKDKSKHNHLVALFEMEHAFAPPPLGRYTYTRKVKTLVDDLPFLTTRQKNKWVNEFVEKTWGSESK